ncbi:MAG: sugar phosphate isomerase/epimerase family protein [Chitinophagales bacterium]
MNEPLSSYFKVGIVQFMAYPNCLKGEGPIADYVKKIVEDDFFQAIEITWVKDPAERKKVADLLRASHMTVGFGAQPSLLTTGYDLNNLNPETRQIAIDQIKAMVDMAAEMGITKVAFLSGKDPGEADREKATALLTDSLNQICAYAQEKGIYIILETFDRTIDKKALIGPAREAAAVAKAVRASHSNFGLMMDLSHLPQQFESAAEALPLVKDYLVHVHIGNCVTKDPAMPAYGDQHPRFGFPNGDVDVPEVADFLTQLFKIGYLGKGKAELPVVAFEVKPVGDESPEVVIANAKRTLLEAWAKVSL